MNLVGNQQQKGLRSFLKGYYDNSDYINRHFETFLHENEQIKPVELQNQNKQVSLKEFYLVYNYLIDFVKIPDFRKKYY